MRQPIVKVALLLCLGLIAARRINAEPPAPQNAPDSIAMRVQPCTACHGERGYAARDGYYPRIAGKPAGYLFNQMLNFQAERRHFPQMVYLLRLQNPSYLREMAQYFASQRIPYPAPDDTQADPAQLALGEQLAVHGDPADQVPACQSCHGGHLLGTEPAVPGLLGVSLDYLVGQLGAFRSGARTASAPDCMAQIAHRLSDVQIQAVSLWLAAQTVSPGTEPDTGFAQPPPLACGSLSQTAAGSGSAATSPSMVDAAVAKGRALVTLGDCEACHTAAGGAAFAGGRAIATPFGVFYSPNITADASTGIGHWSADDFWRALHEGLGEDGRALYPAFPYTNYTRIDRSDSDAIYAYLRSLPPVRQLSRPHDLHFPYNHRSLLWAWRLLYFRPGVYQPDMQRSAQWNRGAYLVQGVAHCSACHEARNSLGALRDTQVSGGGSVLGWYAPSLSAPEQAGMSDWSISDIVTLLDTGSIDAQAESGPHAVTAGPMAEVVHSSLQYASADDLRAMAVYLQSIPVATAQSSVAPVRTPGEVLYNGQALYQGHCATCHGDQGEGSPLGLPLAHNREVAGASPIDPLRVVLFGGYAPGTARNPRPMGMPPYAQSLDDTQIAAVLSYIRNAWGNSAAPVDVLDVGRNRGNPLW